MLHDVPWTVAEVSLDGPQRLVDSHDRYIEKPKTCDGWVSRPLNILRTDTLNGSLLTSALPASGNPSAELSFCDLEKHISSDNDRRIAIILER